ncbi:hypothetical protein GQF03_08135 [Sneathiella chungangensis]|uniref:YCII-related domain-containing protein n=1 Tax=Sneathiella chungangensis TaxID=1418234 RepID=A0A845MG47_9PROT|nr:YciI family protein [Sneathiella chungangensis]MZR22296.1 hypothetical protein [Sneathiella chungangensis]
MPKFVFAYHGGGMPETEEEGAKLMAAWGAWMQKHEKDFLDPGNPVGMSKTVTATGVEDNGGSNPLSGYALVNAADMDAAISIAKGCPITESGGTVEVVEAINI